MAENVNDGGPAFPLPWRTKETNDALYGMSLRAYFAGQAMHGLLTKQCPDHLTGGEEIAQIAVMCADALIKELSK